MTGTNGGVLVVGDKVTFWCNDKLAWESSGITPAEGHVGFQAKGGGWNFATCGFERSSRRRV